MFSLCCFPPQFSFTSAVHYSLLKAYFGRVIVDVKILSGQSWYWPHAAGPYCVSLWVDGKTKSWSAVAQVRRAAGGTPSSSRSCYNWVTSGLWMGSTGPQPTPPQPPPRLQSWGRRVARRPSLLLMGAVSWQSEVTRLLLSTLRFGLAMMQMSTEVEDVGHFNCRGQTQPCSLVDLLCCCGCYSTPTAPISLFLIFFPFWPCLVLLFTKFLGMPFTVFLWCVFMFFSSSGWRMYRKAFSVAYLWTPSFVPSSLSHLFFLTFSPPSPWIPQPHHNTG